MQLVILFDSWLVGLSHVDSISWREGGDDSGGIDFGEALEKGST